MLVLTLEYSESKKIKKNKKSLPFCKNLNATALPYPEKNTNISI